MILYKKPELVGELSQVSPRLLDIIKFTARLLKVLGYDFRLTSIKRMLDRRSLHYPVRRRIRAADGIIEPEAPNWIWTAVSNIVSAYWKYTGTKGFFTSGIHDNKTRKDGKWVTVPGKHLHLQSFT